MALKRKGGSRKGKTVISSTFGRAHMKSMPMHGGKSKGRKSRY